MKNLDVLEREKNEIVQRMNQAIKDNDTEAFQTAFVELCDKIQERVIEQARGIVEESDSRILSERGIHQLTSTERTYYQKLIEAMKEKDPKQALANLDVTMPYTVIDRVFEELRTNHPLLSKIQFESVAGLTKMIMNTNGYQKAAWGRLCEEIVKELTSGFKEVDVTLDKLSAFLPVCKAMLDLGPQWLDRYVREVLYEAAANGLEDGIINGTGKDMPIGMIRQVGDSVAVTGGVYPENTPYKVTKLDDVQLGKLAANVAISEKGQRRTVSDLILVVNPADYYSKVLPASQAPAPGGGYVSMLPFPMEIIQSQEVEVGRAVFGAAKLYFAGSGIENDGRIMFSDEYRFLEDERVYLIKLYANGFPVDNNSFMYLDISDLQPARYKVETAEERENEENADLSDLRIGGNSLTPAFKPETTAYTVETGDASNAVIATVADATAEIEITYNDKVVGNGSRITWEDGENVVKIKVTDGATEKEYQVTVTKSEKK